MVFHVTTGILPGYNHVLGPSTKDLEDAQNTIERFGGQGCAPCVIVYPGAIEGGEVGISFTHVIADPCELIREALGQTTLTVYAVGEKCPDSRFCPTWGFTTFATASQWEANLQQSTSFLSAQILNGVATGVINPNRLACSDANALRHVFEKEMPSIPAPAVCRAWWYRFTAD